MSITNGFEDRHRGECEGVGYADYAVAELLAHTRALEAMLKKHQRTVGGVCPECLAWALDVNHKRGCKLAKLLDGVE